MGAFDEMRDKAEEFAGEHSDQVNEGVEKAGEFADEKTGGRFSDQIDQGTEKAGDFAEGLGGGGDEEENQ